MDRQPVRLMHYDPRWRQEFEQTRSSVLHCCRGWVVAVEHIGSTAVSGIVSRPTIDAMAGVTSDDAFEPAANLMEGLNYRRVDSPIWAKDAIVLEKPRHPTPDEPTPTHQILLMRLDCRAWTRAIGLRDWLRNHAEDAIRFEEAKVARWRSGEGDPLRYQSDKAIFFAHLEDQIRADG
jgi:GrpB-like predicted nucleotidyltransferase (UPF0157 family)